MDLNNASASVSSTPARRRTRTAPPPVAAAAPQPAPMRASITEVRPEPAKPNNPLPPMTRWACINKDCSECGRLRDLSRIQQRDNGAYCPICGTVMAYCQVTMPTTIVARFVDRPPVVAPAPEPVVYDERLAGMVERFLVKIAPIRKLKDEDVAREPRLRQAAADWLARTEPGQNEEFLVKVKAKLDVRPEFRAASITESQARGVLNFWLQRVKRNGGK